MPKKPPTSEAFTSMQILSAKAQSLWSKARTKMKQEYVPGPDVEPPKDRQKPPMLIDIRARTVAKSTLTVLLVLLTAVVVFIIRDKLLILTLGLFLAIVMDAHVRRLEWIGIPRGLAVALLYVIFLSIVIFLVASLIPIVALQIQDLAGLLSERTDAFLRNPEIHLSFLSDNLNEKITFVVQNVLQNMGVQDRTSAMFRFGQSLSGVAQSSISLAVNIAGSVFNFVVNLILILFLAFFIQLEREKILEFVRALLPHEYRSYYDAKADAIYYKIAQWFQGQLMLCATIGILTFIALKILEMPYAQTLALLAAFAEFIPYAGPILGAVPAVFIAGTQSGAVFALIVAAVYYAIQLCENNILVPLIMKHAVGLSPIAIMFGMLVGVSFPDTIHPVLGIMLAVPTTATMTIFVQDFYLYRKKK